MKFIYVDESGNGGNSDVFTMCGVMVDAYTLPRKTTNLDQKIQEILKKYPGYVTELKTSQFVNGKDKWSEVSAQERKDFLMDACRLAVSTGGKIYSIGLSFKAFEKACKAGYDHPEKMTYWLASAMFLCSLVQKKMQGQQKNKGLTVVIMDDNKQEMSKLSDTLYKGSPWFDSLYKVRSKGKKAGTWIPRAQDDRFDQVINTAFAIKSNHSSFIQVADAISYVYRRHLELTNGEESWPGEQDYFQALIAILEPSRQKLGQCPDEPCMRFFQQAKHPEWAL